MNKNKAMINMITQQLRTNNVLDEAVLDLYQSLDRGIFVPPAYRTFVYSDMQIPLAHDQLMLTPLEEALIIQGLQLKGHEHVLHIGTGSGFVSALLSRCCKHVLSVDYFSSLTEQAKKSCAASDCNNIEFITGDGCQGWVDRAPYDAIVISAAIPELSDTLKLQVLLGGKLFAIIGKNPIMEGLIFHVDHNGDWTQRLLFETKTPSIINKQAHQPFLF